MVQIAVEWMGQHGDGVALVDGRHLHLPKVLPSELVEAEGGKVARIVSPSPDRIEPFCPKFDNCGGCALQHWREEPYARWKRSLLEKALEAKALHPVIEPMIDAHGEGRRRVSLHVREQEGEWVSGFMEQKSHKLCALETCPVLVPALRDAPLIAACFGPILGNCDVAITAAENGLEVSVKAERNAVPRRIEPLRELFNRWKLLRLAINGEELMSGSQPFVTMGKARVQLPVQSFLQATRAGEEALALLVTEGLRKCKSVADLFCGVGPFTLRLAESMAVHGSDSDRAAVAMLVQAVRHTQGLKPATAEVRDLFRAPLVVSELNAFDGIVLDPPRAGAEAQVRQVAKSQVKQLVYVACDVQTFARDAAILAEGGYKLEKVFPVDQFKWTAHLEMVGWFKK
jgi:23S rRNA (uracil1939-C5)-methyltransferase